MKDATPILDVVCAIIRMPGQPALCLATRRSHKDPHLPGKWEFPGGKVESGELPEEALLREIREELGIDVEIEQSLTPVVHRYPGRTIRLLPFLCELRRGSPRPLEHAELCWLPPGELDALDWAPADLPIVEEWKRFSEAIVPSSEDTGG